MSDVKKDEDFFTTLKNDTFLRLADHSQMGITIIRRGYLKYYNDKFTELFGYIDEDIQSWGKFEYFKIIHPDELPYLLKTMKIENRRSAIMHFRGVRKNGDIIGIENYVYRIRYQNRFAYFSTYNKVGPTIEDKYLPTIIKIRKEKKILVDFAPKIVKWLDENNISFEIINQCIKARGKYTIVSGPIDDSFTFSNVKMFLSLFIV